MTCPELPPVPTPSTRRESLRDKLLLRIHAMALDEAAWEPALGALADDLGADQAALFSPSPLVKAFPAALHELDPGVIAEYGAHWHRHDIWLRRAIEGGFTTSHRVALGDRLVPHREFVHSVFYNELMKRMDAVRVMVAPILPATNQASEVPLAGAFYRSERQAPFGSREASRYEALLPHLAVAAKAYFRIQRSDSDALRWRRVLESATEGYIGLDESLCVVEVSPRADYLLARLTDCLSIHDGRLQALGRVCDDALLYTSLRDVLGGVCPPVSIALGDAHGRPAIRLTILNVSPLWGELPGTRRIAVCVLIDGPRSRIGSSMRERFQLTEAEAQVLRGLLEGHSPKRIAADRGTTVKTVRHQLSSIYRKTGTTNQRRLLTLAARS